MENIKADIILNTDAPLSKAQIVRHEAAVNEEIRQYIATPSKYLGPDREFNKSR